MADDNLFLIELVTPERILASGLASEVVLRTAEGDVTFLAGHTPLVGTVEPGVVRVVRPEGEGERVAAHGGFVQVEQGIAFEPEGNDDAAPAKKGTRVTLLIGVAELAGEIDIERARAALEAAEARVAEITSAGGRGSGEDEEPDAALLEAEAALLRAQIRLEATESGATAPASGV